jgi:Family of unknown function (DUF6152)
MLKAFIKRSCWNAAAAFLLIPALAIAHHGYAEFDQTTKIALKGIVTEFHYTNPHCIVDFDVKSDKGQVQKWHGELGNPLHLKGWTATSLETGNEVSVSGFRAKSGALYLWVTSLKSSSGVEIKPNGKDSPPEDQ